METTICLKYYRWKDTSEMSACQGQWDEWKPIKNKQHEKDLNYWISKGLAYQICEVEVINIHGYEV